MINYDGYGLWCVWRGLWMSEHALHVVIGCGVWWVAGVYSPPLSFLPFLCRLNECLWRHIYSDPNSVCPCIRPLKFRLTFFKLLLFEQVRFNYNQTWIIGALWEPSHYDALRGHMTRSKVIGGQIVIVILVNLFQIAPVRTGSLQLQPNLVHRCTMGTFSLWRSSRSHDKVKGHWRSNCYSYFG